MKVVSTRNHTLFVIALLSFIQIGFSQKSKMNDNSFALRWAKENFDFINIQTTKSPTFISRSLGYAGLTMYESVVYSNPKFQSIISKLNGFPEVPIPDKNLKYDWISVLNTSQSRILRLIWQPSKAMYG